MPNPEIEEFAKLLVKLVRDESIRSCDAVLKGKHVMAKTWRKASHHGDLESIAKTLIPDIVDDTIFHLLLAIDNEHLELRFKAANGKMIDLPEDGLSELAGWYVGGLDGWRELYSKERFTDYTSDLK